MCMEGMLLSSAISSLQKPTNVSLMQSHTNVGVPDGSAELNDSLHASHTALDLVIPLPGLLGRGEVTPVH